MKTRLSSKGQIVLPKVVRDEKGWKTGTELEVVSTPCGVEFRASEDDKPRLPRTSVDEVAGMLKWTGPPASIEDLDRAVLKEARRRWIEKNS